MRSFHYLDHFRSLKLLGIDIAFLGGDRDRNDRNPSAPMTTKSARQSRSMKSATAAKPPVLPFLAIYRQIREFEPRLGDEIFGLAIHRQSVNIRDF